VDEIAARLDDERQRQFWRLVGISVILHGLGGAFFMWNPEFLRPPPLGAALPGVVTVRLLEAPPSGAPPPPAEPAPAPEVKPKPVPPVQKKVVLPEKPKPLEKPKPEPRPKAKPEPEPKPEPKPKPEVKKPEPKPDLAYDDALAQLRKQAGEATAAPAPAGAQAAGAASDLAGSPRGVRLSAEEAAWYKSARIHLARSWVLAPGFRTQPLSALVRVELDAEGNVQGEPRIERRSGNPWYDDSALRAVQKASPLPPPPAAGEYWIEFRPEDFF
jgi:protein TonB